MRAVGGGATLTAGAAMLVSSDRTTACPACGRWSPSGARFCFECGARLEEPFAVEEERKIVTVVFVDLVGFTARAERLDPEQVASLLRPFLAHVRGELERHSGTVEKYVGDAVMALFGAPVAHEDDAERAVRAALAVREWAREGPGRAVRVGVATGEVLVRLRASAAAGEGIAVGDVVNTAARLQESAAVNAVLVDEATYEATGDVVEYRVREPVAAKGKAKPVPAWEAQAVPPRPSRPLSVRTPFVGRPLELALLREAFERVRDGRSPQLVTLVGPPGIGKTRLVHELRRSLAQEQALEWLQGRSLPYGDGTAFSALAEVVKRWAEILDTDDEGRAAEKLRRAVGVLFADADTDEARAVEPHLRALVGLAAAPGGAADARIESFAAWRRLFEAVARKRPLVLALEDLQWADDALLDFVDHLVEWAAASPMLVLCTARPELLEQRPTWGGKPGALMLALRPLDDADIAIVLAGLLGCEPADVPPELLALAGGNPLYAEQFALMRTERGSESMQSPSSVHAVIGARIDALAPEEKQLVEDAAVVGTVFWPGAVTAVGAGVRAATTSLLHRLESKDLVTLRRRSSVAGEPEYAFAHGLVCDVAYGRVPCAARVEKHCRAAEWLEAVARPEDHAETLAHHYASAVAAARTIGAPPRELERRTRLALRRAGERAVALNAFAAAARHFRAALELWPPDDPRRPRLLLRLAQARWIAEAAGERELVEARDALLAGGDHEGAAEADALLCELYWYRGERETSWRRLDAASALLADAPASPAKAHVLARLSRQLMLAGSYEESISVGREALELATRFHLDELRASTLNSIGSARTRAGDPDGIRDVERAIEIARPAGSRAAVVAYNNLATLRNEAGDLRRSGELLREARRLAERLGDRGYLEWAVRELAVRAYATGDWDEVTAFAERLRSAPSEPHYLDGLVRCTVAAVLQARGDGAAAAAESARGEAAARRVGDSQVLLACLAQCAFVDLLGGRADSAGAHAEEVLRLARAGGYLPPGASFELAAVLADSSRRRELLELLDGLRQSNRWFEAARALAGGEPLAAAELYAEIGSRAAEAYARTRAADALATAGREDEAAAQRALAAAFYRRVRASRLLDSPTHEEPAPEPAHPRR